jgi:hypothetical protein
MSALGHKQSVTKGQILALERLLLEWSSYSFDNPPGQFDDERSQNNEYTTQAFSEEGSVEQRQVDGPESAANGARNMVD